MKETNKLKHEDYLKLDLEFWNFDFGTYQIIITGTVNMAKPKRQKMSALQLEDLPDEMILKVKNFSE